MIPSLPSIRLGSGLAIGYDRPIARADQEVELRSGTHYLLARNGRGKTTLLRTLAKSVKCLAGTLEVSGVTQYLAEDLRFDPHIPTLSIFKSLIPQSRLQDAIQLAQRVELDLHQLYGRLSTGNRRKVSLILGEHAVDPHTPHVLLLDEPFSGLDAKAREIFEELWKSNQSNVVRLVSCHPDYDSMAMPSALTIDQGVIQHHSADHQTWSQLKPHLN